MDGTPSRHVSFSLQVEETTTDYEILLDNRHHGTCDSMNGEMDRSETIFGIEEGLESGISKTGDVQPGSPRNDGVNKANIQLFHREVCEMGASFHRFLAGEGVRDCCLFLPRAGGFPVPLPRPRTICLNYTIRACHKSTALLFIAKHALLICHQSTRIA